MSVSGKDHSRWQGRIADCMDIDRLHISGEGNGAVNFVNNDRVALPGNRINWDNGGTE